MGSQGGTDKVALTGVLGLPVFMAACLLNQRPSHLPNLHSGTPLARQCTIQPLKTMGAASTVSGPWKSRSRHVCRVQEQAMLQAHFIKCCGTGTRQISAPLA
jgi:hypothetical protein